MGRKKYLSQTDVPKYSLETALKVATGIVENYAGDPTSPIQVASAIDIKPSSSNFRDICGASIAYGLTKGGYGASKIELTPLGNQILKPTDEGEDVQGLLKAALNPRVLREFFKKYNNAKFPKDNIAKNVLEHLGVPPEKLEAVLEIIKENGTFLGILQEIKGSLYVHIESPTVQFSEAEEGEEVESQLEGKNGDSNEKELPDDLLKKLNLQKPSSDKPASQVESHEKIGVFITHGKNKKIVEQIKELLVFGQFEPIVSVEKETTAKPVPDKVFEDMRACQAAVIHVENEKELLDSNGSKVKVLNSNVLIEIGAAMALYGKKFILLCQKDVDLPSNLQGLYRCNYEGDSLDYNATMKLLKSFNEIRK